MPMVAERPVIIPIPHFTPEQVERAFNSLTPGQHKVFSLIANGMSYQEVADELVVTVSTVEAQMRKIKLRIGYISEYSAGRFMLAHLVKYGVRSERIPHDMPEDKLERLSYRELEVSSRIHTGMSNRDIEDDRRISLKTVEDHRSRIIQKLETRPQNKYHLIARLEHMSNHGLLYVPRDAIMLPVKQSRERA